MMGILSYQVPSLFELLQIIGIEQMSAGFLAKPLIVEVYRSFVDYGMEQASEELTGQIQYQTPRTLRLAYQQS